MRQLKITKSITNRESQSLDKYLQEIGREELITAEQEVELAQRIKQGDQIALEKLTKANLRFVVSVAKQYQNQGLTLPDLINEGNLGLIKAAQRFDETRGFKFISYAAALGSSTTVPHPATPTMRLTLALAPPQPPSRPMRPRSPWTTSSSTSRTASSA
jgi:hypothetical protein